MFQCLLAKLCHCTQPFVFRLPIRVSTKHLTLQVSFARWLLQAQVHFKLGELYVSRSLAWPVSMTLHLKLEQELVRTGETGEEFVGIITAFFTTTSNIKARLLLSIQIQPLG